ncbi:hypothetical protein [Runella limosa]|uniref:hypothetical protein n=1 Tax=Runella limosa TaxID=370978 RepID=UPI0012F7B8D1|nr:hypothetical protein [Runella limosa]
MKPLTFIFFSLIVVGCNRRIDKGVTFKKSIHNSSNHTAKVVFYPTSSNSLKYQEFTLLPNQQRDMTLILDTSIIPIGADFPFTYGNDSIRIIFDNNRFVSFKQPKNKEECENFAANIFCSIHNECVTLSNSTGQCTYYITNELFKISKPL